MATCKEILYMGDMFATVIILTFIGTAGAYASGIIAFGIINAVANIWRAWLDKRQH